MFGTIWNALEDAGSAATGGYPTMAPTTPAPTTGAPTTLAPSTAAPSTAIPTTPAPTTPAPTTPAPTTQAPTTAAPTTAGLLSYTVTGVASGDGDGAYVANGTSDGVTQYTSGGVNPGLGLTYKLYRVSGQWRIWDDEDGWDYFSDAGTTNLPTPDIGTYTDASENQATVSILS